jgi:hypothetical protein
MTNNITPPPELRAQWRQDAPRYRDSGVGREDWLMDRAAQWGADQELEACLRLVEIDAGEDAYDFARYIRAARRPKPPSLKEQALKALAEADLGSTEAEWSQRFDTIRRALEQLND